MPTLANSNSVYAVPHHSDKFTSCVDSVPADGRWYVVATDLAYSTAEQTARKLNGPPGGRVEWGFRQLALNGFVRSELAVRVAPGTRP